ncbi:hypothetical protein PV327_007769 [Microctonus hyperodae]|uniref:Protein-L-isoaspartate O-methyltransferase domain-containing protein 1 n=1 Tax=Microctonus hyperodae TaxID=165561 RepID=A0AA39KYZ6_MICHY|nr:hypothetical protein PV327_007769 [Microctonus hyperodae]
MGNIVTNGSDNDDLVDILRVLGYIETKKVERVFRAVDRGDYVLAAHREAAYKDLSWKVGNIHLSAPCIYGKVMEGLSLESGLSFLNLGSGTGYLSTMAGLILNHHGTNHGIELHKDCLDYAYEKLEEFKQKSLALDEFDFCEPVFMHGNCLKLEPNRQYDRVYCGAACPESHEPFIKQFVKIGGILVMPYKENLLQIERIDDNLWKHKSMLPVSFAPLIIPKNDDQRSLQLPRSEPLSLQELSRYVIRSEIRNLLWKSHPELQTCDFITTGDKKTSNTEYLEAHQLIPFYNASRATIEDDDDEDDDEDEEDEDEDEDDDEDNDDVNGDDIGDEDDEVHSHSQLFLYVRAGSRSSTPVERSILSKTNENSVDVFDRMSDDNGENESSEIKNCDAINTIPSTADADSPSTSYQNNVAANKSSSDNDNISPLTKEIVNTKVTNKDQSSTVNTAVEKENKLSQSHLDIDDPMELDVSTEQLECSKNSDSNYKIDSSYLSESKLNESKNDQNQMSDTSSDDNEENLIDSSERDASMSYSSSSDHNYVVDDETNSSMEWWFNAIEWHRMREGVPAYKCNSDNLSNNCSQRSETNDQDGSKLKKTSQVFAHHVDINVLSSHMRDKISQLPLPTSLLMYINYNRNL